MSTAIKQSAPHHGAIFKKVLSFVKKNAVLVIATLAAIITSCIVTPDKEYINYFDFKTLTCLFCVLAVVCALRNVFFFTALARKIVKLFKNTRACISRQAFTRVS